MASLKGIMVKHVFEEDLLLNLKVAGAGNNDLFPMRELHNQCVKED